MFKENSERIGAVYLEYFHIPPTEIQYIDKISSHFYALLP